MNFAAVCRGVTAVGLRPPSVTPRQTAHHNGNRQRLHLSRAETCPDEAGQLSASSIPLVEVDETEIACRSKNDPVTAEATAATKARCSLSAPSRCRTAASALAASAYAKCPIIRPRACTPSAPPTSRPAPPPTRAWCEISPAAPSSSSSATPCSSAAPVPARAISPSPSPQLHPHRCPRALLHRRRLVNRLEAEARAGRQGPVPATLPPEQPPLRAHLDHGHHQPDLCRMALRLPRR